MSRIIEAKAVISAADKTGNVLDKIAAKFKGLEKNAKAMEGIKPLKFTGNLDEELKRLRLTEKELQGVRKAQAALHSQLMSDPVGKRPSMYFRAMDDWKNKTVGHWREVKAGVDEAEKAHKKFFASAGRFGMHAIGLGSGAYLAGRAIHAGAKQIGDRGREEARYSLGGISPEERAAAAAKADELSSKYPSVSRTEVLGHVRQLRARLGDFDHAMENVETLTKAQVVLGTLGHGENAGEDLEKLVLGLESQGIGSQPAKFKTYLDAFVKAKSLFPDLKGEDFRQYMQRANASKYGLSEDYLTGVVPTMMQHEGASNFGTMQASAFSALIGKRQTKESKAAMRRYGLLGEDGTLTDEQKFIKNPYRWATENLAPALEAKGVKLDEEHRDDLVKAVTQMFSNRKVGEFFASQLVNRAVIEKDLGLLPGAKGTEGAAISRREDPYVALAGLTTQAKDLATAFIGTKEAIEAMNSAADAFAKRSEALKKGDWLGLLPEDDQRIIKAAREAMNDDGGNRVEMNRRDVLQRQLTERQQMLASGRGDAATNRMKIFDLEQGLHASRLSSGMPPIFSQEELDRWQEIDRERRRGAAYSTFGKGGVPGVPSPESDPRKSGGMPAVQSLEGATVQLTGEAEVKGEVTATFTAGSELIRIVDEAKKIISMAGKFMANGVGSNGKSSPDAAAPPSHPSGGHH